VTPARLDLAAEVQRKQQQHHHHGVRMPSQNTHQPASQQQQQQQQQQQHRRPRVGESRPAISVPVYPAVVPAMPGSPSAMQREQQQQQQHWSNIPGGQPGKGLVRGPGGRV
jgi:hypothetical protein